METRLKYDWMGFRAGDVIDLHEPVAKDLRARNIGEDVNASSPRGRKSKSMTEPPKNKMQTGSKNK